MTKFKSLCWKSLIFLGLFTASLSLLPAQIIGLGRPRGRKEAEDYPARINVGQSLVLSQEFSRYGSSSFGFTNMYSSWDVGVKLPKSELNIDFSLGGQFSDSGESPGGQRFTLYKSLFNTFDISYAHQFNRKWDLTVSDTLMAYPNLNRYSGYSDFAAATGQGPNFARASGAFQSAAGRSGGSAAASGPGQAPLAYIGDLGGYGYGGYLGGYGIGSFLNEFNASLSYAIDSRRQLAFTYDNFRQGFGHFGFATNSFTTSYTQQLTPKLSFVAYYSVGKFDFSEDDGADPNVFLPQSTGLTHSVLAGLDYSVSPDLSVGFTIGPSFTPGEEGTTIGLASTGSISLTKSFRDKSHLSLEYVRFVGANFSRLYTGRDATDELMLTYSRELSKRMGGSFSVIKYSNPFFGSGTIIGGDISYRFTKKLTGDFNVFYFPAMRSSNFGALGSGITNSFTLAYPLTKSLSAFVSYYFTIYGTDEENDVLVREAGAARSPHIFGNSISVGIMHTIPSLIKIGRMK